MWVFSYNAHVAYDRSLVCDQHFAARTGYKVVHPGRFGRDWRTSTISAVGVCDNRNLDNSPVVVYDIDLPRVDRSHVDAEAE